jgi:hypothetical protein
MEYRVLSSSPYAFRITLGNSQPVQESRLRDRGHRDSGSGLRRDHYYFLHRLRHRAARPALSRTSRLVTIGNRFPKLGLPKANAGAADYFDWRKRQQVFDDIALTRLVANFNLNGVGEPERLLGARSTASLFSTLRVTPLIGRVFTEEEQLDPERAATVAVLSYNLWRRRFGADPAIVGRRVRLNGRTWKFSA